MAKLANATDQCKCRNLSPLRAARAEALLTYLANEALTHVIGWVFYQELEVRFDWRRSITDQALNDLVNTGKAQFRQNALGFAIELQPGEVTCLTA